MKLCICTTVPDYFSSMYRSLGGGGGGGGEGKGPKGGAHCFVLRQGPGQIFVTSLNFTAQYKLNSI